MKGDEARKLIHLIYILFGLLFMLLALTIVGLALGAAALIKASANEASDACQSAPCLNNGTCVGVPPDYYICTCVASYYGKNCQTGKIVSSDLINHDGFLINTLLICFVTPK